jgi:seryl-tRNA synthetase
MYERMSKAAAANERSLSEEVEARLTESFDMPERMAQFRDVWTERIKERQNDAERILEELKAAREESRKLRERADELKKEEQEFEKHIASLSLVDALLGENAASRDLLRKIAVELINNPDWDRSTTDRQAIAARIQAYIFPQESLASDSNQPISRA